MKHIEDTPWWICDPEDTNYIAYSDTDSIYVHAEPLLRHLYPDFEEMSSEDKDDKLENIKNNNIQKCLQWCIKYKIPYYKNFSNLYNLPNL